MTNSADAARTEDNLDDQVEGAIRRIGKAEDVFGWPTGSQHIAVAQVYSTLAVASALQLIATAIREGWEDDEPDPDEGADVTPLKVVHDGIPDPTSVTGWAPGHSPASLGRDH